VQIPVQKAPISEMTALMTVTGISCSRLLAMSELDDVMEQHMAYIVFKEHRPFSYRDFLQFEVEGKEYEMVHGTFRNKISKLIKAGVVESSYNSCLTFYTLKGIKFGKRMTGNHMGDVVSHSHSDPIVKLIRNLPFDRNALHDIHLRFQVKGCWSLLLSSADSTYRMHPISKDIHLPALEVGDLRIRTTVHKTDTVSITVGCSYSPIAVDTLGIICLSNALTRVEERLSRLIEDCGKIIVPSPCQYQRETSSIVIPKRAIVIPEHNVGEPLKYMELAKSCYAILTVVGLVGFFTIFVIVRRQL
jgi:hypothetical protein